MTSETETPPPSGTPPPASDPAAAASPSPAVGTRRFLDETVRLFATAFQADRATLFLYEAESNTLTLRAAYAPWWKATSRASASTLST